MTGAEEPQKPQADGIEAQAELDPGAGAPNVSAAHDAEPAPVSVEVMDDAIEVADDEIEVAAELPARPTQPSPPSSTGVLRSRPPMRPSARPRPSSGSALPPPRGLAGSEPGSGWPPSSRPSSSDPWLLANKTLELSRAHARIAELEEQLAFRDARIVTLEEKLQKAQQRLADLEQKPSVGRADVAKPAARSAVARPVVTETRLVAALRPAASASPVQSTEQPGTSSGHAASAPIAATTASAALSPAGAAGEEDEEEVEDESASLADADVDGVESLQPGDTSRGDLRQISGIGPRFEAALRKQGITRLSQIAAWSDADVRQVAKALRIPKSRIVKGRWVEAAREAIGARVASE